MRRAISAFFAGLLLWAPVVQAATLQATPATLTAVLKSAQPGDIVVLGPQTYLTPVFKAGAMPDGLTVDATGATLMDAKIWDAKGLTINGGTFRLSCTVSCSGAPALDMGGVQTGTVLKGGAFAGAGVGGYGMRLNNVSGVTIQDPSFDGFQTGITIGASHGVKVLNSTFRRMGSDGVSIGWSSDILIDGIDCRGGVPSTSAHPDCVQGFSRATFAPTSDITVRHVYAEGNTDGVLFSNKASRSYPAGTKLADGTILAVATNLNDGGFDRIRVEDVTAVVSQPNGVTFAYARDSTMRNVKISTAVGSTYGARFVISADSTMRERCGNSYAAFGSMAAFADPPCAAPTDPKDAIIADLSAKVTQLTADLSAMTAKANSLQVQLGTANQTIADLGAKLSAANDNLAAANQNLVQVTAERDAARASVDDLNTRIAAGIAALTKAGN